LSIIKPAILALYAAEQPTLAHIFAALILLHLPLTFLFNQRGM
jgi:hypothetical protein